MISRYSIQFSRDHLTSRAALMFSWRIKMHVLKLLGMLLDYDGNSLCKIGDLRAPGTYTGQRIHEISNRK